MQHNISRLRTAALFVTAISLASPPLMAQPDERLCQGSMKPGVATLTLHWDNFNMFGNVKDSSTETGFSQSGEGSACKINSQLGTGRSNVRPCTWTPRLSCELQLGKEPVTHSFSVGSYQRGKLQWARNETLTVNVRRGDTTTAETREVAVVTFNGTWSRSSDRGDSVSAVYYDRDWGVMLKAEGAHDANMWGNTVSLIEIKP